jgi:hypothetical protein
MLHVVVEAFDVHDADDAIKDAFGEGEFCGVEVTDFEVVDFEDLTDE